MSRAAVDGLLHLKLGELRLQKMASPLRPIDVRKAKNCENVRMKLGNDIDD